MEGIGVTEHKNGSKFRGIKGPSRHFAINFAETRQHRRDTSAHTPSRTTKLRKTFIAIWSQIAVKTEIALKIAVKIAISSFSIWS
jgi:Holliday junction resolvase RusA-like endonuclease